MSRVSSLCRTSVLALLLGTGSAVADVNAFDVWNGLKAAAEANGQTLTIGSEEQVGDTLTIKDITTEITLPEGDGTISSYADQLVIKDLGDGTVEITIPEDFKLDFSGEVDGGDELELSIVAKYLDSTLVASGAPDNIAFDFTGDRIDIVVERFVIDDEELKGDMLLSLAGVVSDFTMKKDGELFNLVEDMTVDMMTIKVDVSDPTNAANTMKLNSEIAELGVSADISMFEDMDPEDFGAVLKAGGGIKSELSHGEMSYDFSFTGGNDNVAIAGGAESGLFSIAMVADGLSYITESKAMELSFSGSEIPVPASKITLDEAALRFEMPIAASDEPQDFTFLLSYRGFAIPDTIWGLFDPKAVLPRDPATVVVDLSGEARWLIDIMSPEAAAMSAPPGELTALTLNGLEFSAAGASFTGSGGFTFDNTDLATFDGMPRPEGDLNLKMVGANGLMDNLIQMGILPQEEAMGFRMMIGMFARPGDGEDELVSEIQVDGEGKILANGQPLPF